MLKSYCSERPGQFLEQLLIVPNLRLRIPNCIDKGCFADARSCSGYARRCSKDI